MRKVFFISAFCAHLSFGALPDFVVKIESGLCQDPNPFHGSGLLIGQNGKAFVITSDHVVVHNYQDPTCHQITNELFGKHRASFDVAEWGNGLALLEVPDLKPDATWPTIADLKPLEQVSPGEGATVAGFPADSDSLIIDKRGAIAALDAELPFFAQVPRLLEIKGAHGEFGMSGGIAYNNQGYLGLLSHQRVLSSENQLFVIPALVVYEWLKGALNEGIFLKTYFSNWVDDQLLKIESVKTAEAGYDFVLFDAFHHVPKIKSVRIQAFNDPTNPKHFRDPFGRLERMYGFLSNPSTHTQVQLRYFRRGSLLSRDATLVSVTGLVDFFQKVAREEFVPVFVTPLGSVDWEEMLALKALAVQLAASVLNFKHTESSLLQELGAAGYWLQLIPESIESLDERWTIVTTTDIDRMLKGSGGWSQLSGENPSEATHLRALLKRISQSLSRAVLP